MDAFLSAITSEIAIILYLCIAITCAIFFIVKYQKKNIEYKRKLELQAIQSREDNLNNAITNEKKGS